MVVSRWGEGGGGGVKRAWLKEKEGPAGWPRGTGGVMGAAARGERAKAYWLAWGAAARAWALVHASPISRGAGWDGDSRSQAAAAAAGPAAAPARVCAAGGSAHSLEQVHPLERVGALQGDLRTARCEWGGGRGRGGSWGGASRSRTAAEEDRLRAAKYSGQDLGNKAATRHTATWGGQRGRPTWSAEEPGDGGGRAATSEGARPGAGCPALGGGGGSGEGARPHPRALDRDDDAGAQKSDDGHAVHEAQRRQVPVGWGKGGRGERGAEGGRRAEGGRGGGGVRGVGVAGLCKY